jgi:DNA-directed RNA polymerase specialized sigma24 family protein
MATLNESPFDCAARFEQLVRFHTASVTRLAIRLSYPVGSQDVVAGVFEVAWLRFDDLVDVPGSAGATAWLRAITTHVAASSRRAHQRRAGFEISVGTDVVRTMDPAADATMLSVEDRAYLQQLCRALGTLDQHVMALVAAGYRSTEIALILGVTPAAARQRLRRARQRMHRFTGRASHGGTP